MRHTHATLLLKAAVPVKVVSERLGHASPGFTLNVYQHVLPGMQAEAAAVFEHLLDEPASSDHLGIGDVTATKIPDATVARLEVAAAARGMAVDALLNELVDSLGADA